MSMRPVMIPCRGGSPLSQQAALAAEGLRRRGLVRRSDGSAPAAGEAVVALDGCPSACASRRLAAQGHPPTIRLSLAECGVTENTVGAVDRAHVVDELARQLLDARRRPTALARPVVALQQRPVGPRRAHTVNDYLIAIDSLTNPVAHCGAVIADVPTLAAHVSGLLGVSRPSAGEMLGRMEQMGLVRRGVRKELLLTRGGRAAADRAVRRHRLLEVFSTAFLGFAIAECHARARALDPAFDDDAIEHLSVALAAPSRCPHGWPIDAGAARDEADALVALTALAPGSRATVACVREDAAVVAELVQQHVVPGTTVTVIQRGSYDVGGARRKIGDELASAVLVTPTADGACGAPPADTPGV